MTKRLNDVAFNRDTLIIPNASSSPEHHPPMRGVVLITPGQPACQDLRVAAIGVTKSGTNHTALGILSNCPDHRTILDSAARDRPGP
jgi:hypothetical protein